MFFVVARYVIIELWRLGHTVDRCRIGAYFDSHR
jgi:hypothetical protein